MVTGEIAPDKLDEAVRLWREHVAPSVQRQPGFRSVRLLIDRQAGRVLSLAIWDDVQAVQRSAAWNQEQVARFQGLFTTPPRVEEGFEVAVELTAP
jgi:heme-degrading monooxygenase HmoA